MNYLDPSPKDVFSIPRLLKTSFKNADIYTHLCIFISFILGVLYFIGIGDLDYGYYTFLRVFSFVAIIVFMIALWNYSNAWDISYTSGKKVPEKYTVAIIAAMLIVWILFNPIFPIYSSKDVWVILDIISGLIMWTIAGSFIVRQTKQNYENCLFVVRGTVIYADNFNCRIVAGNYVDINKNILYWVKIDTKKSNSNIKKGDEIVVHGRLEWVHRGEITEASIKKARCYHPRQRCGTFF